MLISLDPGLQCCGIAGWIDGRLRFCDVMTDHNIHSRYLWESRCTAGEPRGARWAAMAYALSELVNVWVKQYPLECRAVVVAEIPQVYKRGKGDPNDLIDVAGVAAAFMGACVVCFSAEPVWTPLPFQWKGQLTKEVTAERLREHLTADEYMQLPTSPKSLIHNAYDAAYLGLTYLQRYGTRK